MLNALMLLAFVETASVEGTAIRCDFPGQDPAQKPIRVVLEPRPSLKDQPGLFRVIMEMNGKVSLRAMAQPIASTSDRDIMIRGRHGTRSMYSLGLRDDGQAAFNMQTSETQDATIKKQTRIGACHGFETLIKRWLPS